MKISIPAPPADLNSNEKLSNKYKTFKALIDELNSRSLPDSVAEKIEMEVLHNKQITGDAQSELAELRKRQTNVLSILQKDLNIVPKNHYMSLWMALGMAAFGIPLGVAYGLMSDNMAMLSIGIPIGMGIGIAIGSGLDKKASAEGRQLKVDLKH